MNRLVSLAGKISQHVRRKRDQQRAQPNIVEWPLFERMRLSSKGDALGPGRTCSSIRVGIAAHVAIHAIPAHEFDAKRLLEEIADLPEHGGEVHLPAGRIELTEELRLRSGVHIIGVPGATELVFKGTHFGLTITGGEKAVTGVRVQNLRIRHEGECKFSAAIFATCATDLVFSELEIIAPRGIGFLFSDGVHRVRLGHCAVYNAGLWGFMMMRDVRDTVLQSCVAEWCDLSGILLTDMKLPDGTDPLDFDAQMHYTNSVVGNAAPFAPDDPTPCRNTLIDCSFCRNRRMGVSTDGLGYLRVINCTIANNDCEGITLDNGTWGCQVQNCRIRGN